MRASYRANLGKMYVVQFLYYTHFVAAVLVPFYISWGGLKFSHILFLNAWFMAWIFLLEIPTGTVADFLGRKVSLVMGQAVGILGVLVYVSHPHILVFMVGEVLLALSFTLMSGANEALVYDTLKELGRTDESKKIFSRMESIKLAGIMAGAAAGGVIADHLGLYMPLLLQSIPFGLGCLAAVTLKEPPCGEEKPQKSFRGYIDILTRGVGYFFKHRILKILTLDMVVVGALAWLIIWFYQALLGFAGMGISYFGFVHAGMCAAQIAIISLFPLLERMLGSKRRLLFFTAFVTGMTYLALSVVRSLVPVVVAILLSAGFGLSRGPLFSSYMNKHIPSDKRATVLSTTSMMRTFSIMFVNLAAGLLTAWSIPYTLAVLGAAIVAFSFFSKIKEEHLLD